MTETNDKNNYHLRANAGKQQHQKPGLETTQIEASDDNEFESAPKRRRVSKACDQCRHGKLKCNGKMPRCGTCAESRKSCSYGAAARRRGLRTGYVRALECLWGLVFQTVGAGESTVENLVVNTSKKNFWLRDDARDGPKSNETPLEAWKSSKIPRLLDSLLSAEDHIDDDKTSISSNNSTQMKNIPISWNIPGDSTVRNRKQMNFEQSELCQRCHKTLLEQDDVVRITGHNSNSSVPIGDSEGRRLLRLPPNPQLLLDHFLAFTHSWFPIVERHSALKTLFSYRKGQISLDAFETGDHAILWAIFAYSSLRLDGLKGPEHISNGCPTSSEDLYLIARSLIPLERDDNYSLGHVQALVVLCLFHHSLQQWNTARLMIGSATLLASHISCDQKDNHSEYHRRAWLACFVLDTLVSTSCGRSPRLRSEHIRAFFPIDESSNEEWEPWRLHAALKSENMGNFIEFIGPTHSLSVFNQFLGLLCIINDMTYSDMPDSIQVHQESLKYWNECLPEHMKTFLEIDDVSENSSLPSANMLNLLALQVFIYIKISSIQDPGQQNLTMESLRINKLIQALETFKTFFAKWILPSAVLILQNVLDCDLQQQSCIDGLIAGLKKLTSEHRPTTQTGTTTGMRNAPFDTSDLVTEVYNVNQDDHNLTSLLSIEEPSDNMDVNQLLDMNNPSTNLGLNILQPSNLVADDATLLQHPIVDLENSALEYLNAWDDLEIPDPDQFRRNLGYIF